MPSFTRIIQALNEHDVSYVIIGGLAVLLHGHVQSTPDVDVAISPDTPNVHRATAAIASLGLRGRFPKTIEDALKQESLDDFLGKGCRVCTVSFADPGWHLPGIDVLLFTRNPLVEYQTLFARSELREIKPSLQARVCSLNDLIALKKIANRLRDQADLEILELIREDLKSPLPLEEWPGGWDAHRRDQTLRVARGTTPAPRVEWLEEVAELFKTVSRPKL